MSVILRFLNLFEKGNRLDFLVQKYWEPLINKLLEDLNLRHITYRLLRDDKAHQFFHPFQFGTSPEGQKANAEVLKIFSQLATFDPTSNTGPQGEIRQAGGYTEWIIRAFLGSPKRLAVFLEDGYKLRDDLDLYSRIKGRLPQTERDINKIKDPLSLYRLVEPFRKELKKTKIQASKDIVTLLSSPTEEVFVPLSWEAARMLGGDTRWCTSSSNCAYFDSYAAHGPLFIIFIHPEGAQEPLKYQFQYESGSFMDAEDERIDEPQFLKAHPAVKKAIASYYTKELEGISAKKTDSATTARALSLFQNLIYIGAYDEINALMKAGHLSPELLNSSGLDVLVFLLEAGEISAETLQKKREKDPTALFEAERFYLVFRDFSDPNILDFFEKNDQSSVQYIIDGSNPPLPEPVPEDILFSHYWSYLDDKALQEIRLKVAEKLPDALSWGDSELRSQLYENPDDQFSEIIQALCDAAGEAQAKGEESAQYNHCVHRLMGVLGPMMHVHDHIGFEFPYSMLKSWISAWNRSGRLCLPTDHVVQYAVEYFTEKGLASIDMRRVHAGFDHTDFREALTHHLDMV